MVASNAGDVLKNRDSRQISGPPLQKVMCHQHLNIMHPTVSTMHVLLHVLHTNATCFDRDSSTSPLLLSLCQPFTF